MRCLLIICLFVLAGHRVESAPKKSDLSSDKGCVPGSSWKDQCNSCSCNRNGIAVCTLALCLGSEGAPKMTELPSGKECLPGSSWRSQCNDCSCDSNGIAVCTLKSCLGNEQEPMKTCAARTTWKKECNTCWCTTSGQAVCTLRGCFDLREEEKSPGTEPRKNPEEFVEGKKLYHRLNRAIRCSPSEEFQLECNTCKCSQTGQSYTCTQEECFTDDTDSDVDVFIVNNEEDHMESHSVCKPRDTFYVSCNACRCNNFGTDYACTNKPCPLPKDVEVFHELNEMNPVVPISRGEIDNPKA